MSRPTALSTNGLVNMRIGMGPMSFVSEFLIDQFRLYLRLVNYTRTDTQAPGKITNLVAYRKEGEERVIMRWTPVDSAGN